MNMRHSISVSEYQLRLAVRTATAVHSSRTANADYKDSTVSFARTAGSFCIRSRQGFGLNEVIGIAAGIIIAVVVVIPGLRGFAASVLDQLTDWWNSMAAGIFAG